MQALICFYNGLPAERVAGMRESLEAANRRVEDWADLALLFLENYCRTNAEVFGEDVTNAAAAWGLEAPKDKRAWGGIYVAAQKRGFIADSDKTRRRVNGSKATVYRSLIYGKGRG